VGRGEALSLQQSPHQLQRRGSVAPALHQDIEDLTLVVDRTPQIEPLFADPDDYLVQVPARAC
jgi:hypothetical protein